MSLWCWHQYDVTSIYKQLDFEAHKPKILRLLMSDCLVKKTRGYSLIRGKFFIFPIDFKFLIVRWILMFAVTTQK